MLIRLSLLFSALIVRDQPLSPARSPDGQVVASTKVSQTFVTPEGGNYYLLLNGTPAYPVKAKHHRFGAYENWHTFLSLLVWSPDSRYVAFVEKIYSWEYLDPYNRNFDGVASNKHFILAVIGRDGTARGYALQGYGQDAQPIWLAPDRIALNNATFNLSSLPSKPID